MLDKLNDGVMTNNLLYVEHTAMLWQTCGQLTIIEQKHNYCCDGGTMLHKIWFLLSSTPSQVMHSLSF